MKIAVSARVSSEKQEEEKTMSVFIDVGLH